MHQRLKVRSFVRGLILMLSLNGCGEPIRLTYGEVAESAADPDKLFLFEAWVPLIVSTERGFETYDFYAEAGERNQFSKSRYELHFNHNENNRYSVNRNEIPLGIYGEEIDGFLAQKFEEFIESSWYRGRLDCAIDEQSDRSIIFPPKLQLVRERSLPSLDGDDYPEHFTVTADRDSRYVYFSFFRGNRDGPELMFSTRVPGVCGGIALSTNKLISFPGTNKKALQVIFIERDLQGEGYSQIGFLLGLQ